MFSIFRIGILVRLIADRKHLFIQYLDFMPLLFCDNCKHLKHIKYFLFFPITLALLVTSIAYAANENCQTATAQPSVAILLSSPNYLNQCLTALSKETVINIHSFLKGMMLLEIDYSGNKSANKKGVSFTQRQNQNYYDLYRVLSLRYYKGQSFTSFLTYMIYNKPPKVINRPLMGAMLKLCEVYKERIGITIGNMLEEVEKQKHSDEDINALLRYKANSVEAQCKALYSDDDTDTKKNSANSNADCSANKEGGASWFSDCSQNTVHGTHRIVKNVSSLASRAMSTIPFSALVISPVSAADEALFTCDNNQEIPKRYLCDGIKDCTIDGSDESIFTCCVGEGEGVNITSRLCFAKNIEIEEKLFVCGDMLTISASWRCNSMRNCLDGSDETIGDTNPTCFYCDQRKRILHELRCDGNVDCANGRDESVIGKNPGCFNCGENNGKLIFGELRCDGKEDCDNGRDENTNGTHPICFHCGNTNFIPYELRCDGKEDCANGRDEEINGANMSCYDCGLNNGGLIYGELRCNGENNCADGSDENCNHLTTGATFSGSNMLAAGAITCATCAIIALVKYRHKKIVQETISWFLSPITKSAKYFRRLYNQL
ncbi:MAG: hypothetical protein QS748_08435 [Candidatus Endonucleobacter bathymodioli]|uniref:Uncharacterized protein n=1 Tax=Candidatus Endonucleibacter bathymodioli TaxID=539814 RepID=A0AA90NVX4_9GAMM|nr:hypothetical protein [Candidatus Endonucleobacter bathymodioli]